MSVSVSVCACRARRPGLQVASRTTTPGSVCPCLAHRLLSLGLSLWVEVWCGVVWAPRGRGEGTRSLGAAAPAALGRLGAGCVLARRRAHRALAHSLPAASSAGHLA